MNMRWLLGGACAAAISACGGTDGSPPPPPASPPPATTSSLVSSSGTITGFGSVFVNGVKYEVEGDTVVAIDGEAETTGDDSALRVGMRVNITATETAGVRKASRIAFDDDLKGPAVSVSPSPADPALGAFIVLGQTVIVDANTVFDDDVGDNDGLQGIDIRDLDPAFSGGVPINVEISGFPSDFGILATRIDRIAAPAGSPSVDGDEFEVKGFVDSVAPDGSSFSINDAVFLVNAGTVFNDSMFANDQLPGVFVEVKADMSAGNLIAVRVEREDDLGARGANNEFEIEGVLQSVDTVSSPNVFVINGMTIQTTDSSSLLGRVGSKVEIKGAFNAAGQLVIATTRLDVENSIRTEDRIASINSSGGSFRTRLGVEITPTESARIKDDLEDDGDNLTPAEFLNRLRVNDFIEARGYPDGDTVVWSRIERDDQDDPECRLRGPVEAGSISDPTFMIEGVTIDTTALGFGGFEDENGVDIGRNAFFGRLVAGAVIEAKSDDNGVGCVDGRLSTGATGEVEFEADDGLAGNNPAPGGGGAPTGAVREAAGLVADLDALGASFRLAGVEVTVTPDTLIDASLVEAARGIELPGADLRFGDLPETLDELLQNGDAIKVVLDSGGNAILIEDI